MTLRDKLRPPTCRWSKPLPGCCQVECTHQAGAGTRHHKSHCTAEKCKHFTASGGERLVLRLGMSPGDVLMLTAAVRDLALQYPGRWSIVPRTAAGELWENNPHVVKPDDKLDVQAHQVTCHYPAVNQSDRRPLHFVSAFHEFLSAELGVPLTCSEFRGDVHLSEQETAWPSDIDGLGTERPLWLVAAGGKRDFTCKWWHGYQQVIDLLAGEVEFAQVGEAEHWHEPLTGAVNLVGRTSLRQLVRLMRHARGVLCPVTFLMHLSAAVPTPDGLLRPAVVIAGGREPSHWEAYPGHQFIHRVGAYPCCAHGGCWRSRCQRIGDGDVKDTENTCERPIMARPDLMIPECMASITPGEVVAAIRMFRSRW